MPRRVWKPDYKADKPLSGCYFVRHYHSKPVSGRAVRGALCSPEPCTGLPTCTVPPPCLEAGQREFKPAIQGVTLCNKSLSPFYSDWINQSARNRIGNPHAVNRSNLPKRVEAIMAAKVKPSPDIQIDPEMMKSLQGSRWLVWFDYDGGLRFKPILPEEFLTTEEKILDKLNNKIVFQPEVLQKFMIGAINNLVHQCDKVNGLKTVNERE